MSGGLKSFLLQSLANLPGSREFHVHTLVSAPRKHSDLYPFSQPRARTYLQDIVLLLSEQSQTDSPRVLVAAIEAALYHIPATSCAILYISKVDSTGQSLSPSPTTTLVRALLSYYVNPATRPISARHLWVQLFARAQGQYLFPNSSEYPAKRPLSDVKLCSWWKRVLADVAEISESNAECRAKIRLFYVLPGYNELEAHQTLKLSSPSSANLKFSSQWIYGHPYSTADIPLPCPKSGNGNNLAHYIPSFDDDPKSRFLDEIAYTVHADGIKSPERKRSRTGSRKADSHHQDKDETADENEKQDEPLGELGKVTPNEFWERMSFRQECVAGAVTGFFALIASSLGDSGDSRSTSSPLAPQAGQVPSQIIKRVMTSLLTGVEFSTTERAIRSTETIESSIKGLCEGLAEMPAVTVAPVSSASRPNSDRRTPDRETYSQPSLLAPPRTPPPRLVRGKRVVIDVSPNPFPEPVTSLETYHQYIYGSIIVNNPAVTSNSAGGEKGEPQNEPVGEPQVTVLTARKKKKRTEG